MVAYIDIVLVLLVAAVALSMGAPALGLTVGAAAWIVVRIASLAVDKRLQNVDDIRRRLGLSVGYSMVRVWVLACAIIAAGVAASRADGLAAALTIFGAFSVWFACSAIAHVAEKRKASA
jgi:hypothetical protein